MVSNHSKVGYEPTLIPDHTGVEESSGNDPQSVSHRSHCLANKPRRLQGLLSIECGTTAVVGAPTLVIPLFVFTTGYDPITFCVSDKRSTNWATWTCCGQGRVRSYNPRINSTMLSQLSYLSICCGREGTRTPKVSRRQIYSLLSQPIAQLSQFRKGEDGSVDIPFYDWRYYDS